MKDISVLPSWDQKLNTMKKTQKHPLSEQIEKKHPYSGDLYFGGAVSVGQELIDPTGSAIAFTLEKSQAYHSTTKGMSYSMAVMIFNGEKEIEVYPMRMWRNGENKHHDNWSYRIRLTELKKVEENVFQLKMTDGKGNEHVAQIDFSSESVRK